MTQKFVMSGDGITINLVGFPPILSACDILQSFPDANKKAFSYSHEWSSVFETCLYNSDISLIKSIYHVLCLDRIYIFQKISSKIKIVLSDLETIVVDIHCALKKDKQDSLTMDFVSLSETSTVINQKSHNAYVILMMSVSIADLHR